MFEKVGRVAETAATKVSLSRRCFLGRLGQGALAVTGVVGGLLAIPRAARARGGFDFQGCVLGCCEYWCGTDCRGCHYYSACFNECLQEAGG